MSERNTFWLSHLSAIEAEGITTKAYAEREGLSPQALYQWRKRLVAGGRSSRAKLGGFVPIQIEPSVTARAGCTVVIDAQLRLECATLPGVDWLAALSAALAERGRWCTRGTASARCICTGQRLTSANPSAGCRRWSSRNWG
jgi:hypothetical protein